MFSMTFKEFSECSISIILNPWNEKTELNAFVHSLQLILLLAIIFQLEAILLAIWFSALQKNGEEPEKLPFPAKYDHFYSRRPIFSRSKPKTNSSPIWTTGAPICPVFSMSRSLAPSFAVRSISSNATFFSRRYAFISLQLWHCGVE